MATKKRGRHDNDSLSRSSVLEAITTPLGFFVLALLIVEVFLGTVLVWADLDQQYKVMGMLLGITMFFVVVVVVAVLDWHKPSNLTFDRDAHLIDRGKILYGTEQATIDPAKALAEEKKEEGR